MSKASEAKLSELHGKLADVLKECLDDLDPEAKGAASILNVARQFLKDNGIETGNEKKGPIGDLAGKLPSFDDEGHVYN